MEFPRIVTAALRGGAGKTILSIGLIAAWKKHGKKVAPFKKGPDYIDAGWLALAAGRPCHNLDTFLIKPELVLSSFLSRFTPADVAVIEGNRGLFDGIDAKGSTSTAELAKLLNAPVILCIDCTKTTRTAAAAVLGCLRFAPEVNIKGVVLNRVAGRRHEQIVRDSIETHCGLPVVGAIPKLKEQRFPERHMGLVPTPEHNWAGESIAAAEQMALAYLDLDALEKIAREAGRLAPAGSDSHRRPPAGGQDGILGDYSGRQDRPRIGIIKDSAFQFYYPENIEALESLGARVFFFSPLGGAFPKEIDALYIGGGFPETHAAELAQNTAFKARLRRLARDGLPVYAECGGLMYLGEALVLEEKSFPMVGLLPVVFGFSKKPQGHGYTVMEVERDNPYFKAGTQLKGHEFHYSRVLKWRGCSQDMVFSVKRGAGFYNGRDGIVYKNVLATYTHIHALGSPFWARALVKSAARYRRKREGAIVA